MTRLWLQSRLLRISVLVTAIAMTVIPAISKVQVATALGVAFAFGALAMIGVGIRVNWRAALPGAVLVGGVIAWTALGLNWAVDPGFSAEKLGRVLPILLLGPLMVLILQHAGDVDGHWLGRVLPLCLVAGIAWIGTGMLIALLDLSVGWPSVVFPSGAAANAGLTTLAIVIWLVPMASEPARGPFGFTAVAAVAALVLLFGQSDAAVLGFAVGGVVYLVGLRRQSLGTAAMVAVLVVSAIGPVVMAPLAYERAWDAIDWLPNSWLQRLEIWDAAVDHAAAQPVGGSGIDSFRLLEHEQPSRLNEGRAQGQATHPHHALLQAWVEIGLVGVGLLTALAVWAVRHILTWPGQARAAAQAGIASAGVVLGLSYGVWQGWWLALLFAASGYAAGLAVRHRRAGQSEPPYAAAD